MFTKMLNHSDTATINYGWNHGSKHDKQPW